MAYSQEALSSLLRRKRQYEAMGGRLSSSETEGLVRGVLSTEASRELELNRFAREEALRKEGLAVQREGIATQKELGERELELAEEKAGAEETAGYLQTGLELAGTKTGEKVLGKVGEGIAGIGKKIFPSATGAAAPALATGGAAIPAMPATMGAGMSTVAGTSIPAIGEAGYLAATAPTAATATGTGMSTVGGATIPALGEGAGALGAVMPALGAAGAIGAGISIGSAIGGTDIFQAISPFGGEKTERRVGGALGGAAAGALVGGPIGAVIGGVVGFVTGGGSVICTELHRQGYITSSELKYSILFKKKIDNDIYEGYHWWASKLVNIMQKSKIVSRIVKPFGVAWVKEMMHRVRPNKFKGNLLGKLLLDIGMPLSRLIGREVKNGRIWTCFGNRSAEGTK